MKHFLIIAALFLGCLACPNITKAESTSTEENTWLLPPELSEIMPNPESGKEWVEIYNPNSDTINLEGLYLCDSRATSCTIAQLSGTLAAGSWQTIYLSTSYLNNTGDTVILKNSTNTLLETMTYSESTILPKKGQSLIKTNNQWQITLTPTPNEDNLLTIPEIITTNTSNSYSPPLPPGPEETIISVAKVVSAKPKEKPDPIDWVWTVPYLAEQGITTTLSVNNTSDSKGGKIFFSWQIGGKILDGEEIYFSFPTSGLHYITISATSTSGSTSTKKINLPVAERTSTVIMTEVSPQSKKNDEYIEIYNPTSNTLSLSGYKIITEKNEFKMATDTLIQPYSHLTFFKKTTGLTLNDTGGTIYLLASTGTLADSVTYDSAKNDLSYSLIDNSWLWTYPSPGIDTLIISEVNTASTSLKAVKSAKITAKTTPNVNNILAAREATKNSLAYLEGTVSVTPGIFGSQYFYLQDKTGGIQIYEHNKKFPPLQIGDKIIVEGVVTSYQDIPRIKLSNLTRDGTNNSFLPAEKNIIELEQDDAGKLISITGEITEKKSSNAYLYDGEEEIVLYFRRGAQINLQKIKEGDIITATGILESTKTGWQLWPRNDGDIKVITSTVLEATETTKPLNKFRYISLVISGTLIYVIYKTKKHLSGAKSGAGPGSN